jgi:nitroreductase
MKRIVLQLFRSLVTFVVVGTMAAMIFSLRAECRRLRAAASAPSCRDGALETIRARRSIRSFDPARAVPDEAIETLLRSAMCAPSAMDRRPWAFVVVRDAARLKELAEALPHSRVGNGAQAAIVVCGATDNGLEGRAKEYWIQDCSAATMALLLAAEAQGLGAVWTGVYPGEDRVAKVRRILSIPEGYEPLNVVPVGWPAENPPPKDKWDPSRIHRDRW